MHAVLRTSMEGEGVGLSRRGSFHMALVWSSQAHACVQGVLGRPGSVYFKSHPSFMPETYFQLHVNVQGGLWKVRAW